MKVNLYAVLDTASGVYDGPVPLKTDEVAIRGFANAANDPNTTMGKNPEFFHLFRVGIWNDATGEIEPMVHESIAKAIDLINPVANLEDYKIGGTQ